MANTQNFSEMFAQLPNAFPVDQNTVQETMNVWASFNERFAGIALTVASKSNDIAANTAKETFSQLRDATKVRQEPSDYAEAASELANAQVDLQRRTVEAFGEVVRDAQTDAGDLITATGQRFSETGTAVAKNGVEKGTAKAKQASKAAS